MNQTLGGEEKKGNLSQQKKREREGRGNHRKQHPLGRKGGEKKSQEAPSVEWEKRHLFG